MWVPRLIRWWTSRVRIWGRENYIRFAPNPGFRFVYHKNELRWNLFYGWHIGRIR